MINPKTDQLIRDFLHYAYTDTSDKVYDFANPITGKDTTEFFLVTEKVMLLCEKLGITTGYVEPHILDAAYPYPDATQHTKDLILSTFAPAYGNPNYICCGKKEESMKDLLQGFTFKHKLQAFSDYLHEDDQPA